MTLLTSKDALLIVDVQNDFLPGGKLAVPEGDEIVPVLSHYIERFARKGLVVCATREWHPEGHCSFKESGGSWPQHCISDTHGADFPPGLKLPDSAIVVSRASLPAPDSYSGFEGTDLTGVFSSHKVKRLFVGGLATDYCVLNTVTDALSLGFEVCLMIDAIKAVNVHPGDGKVAVLEMLRRGAQPVTLADINA